MITKSSESVYSVSVGILAQMVRYLSNQKVDTDRLFQTININPNILASPDERITVEMYSFIEDAAAKITNDPCFGLHMGQYVEAGNWSILGYMMMNCRTINEALAKFTKNSSIIGNVIKGEVHASNGTITIFLTVPKNAPDISRHCYEGYFSSIICLARTLSGKNITPVKTGFAFSEPESIVEYERVFASPVLFGQNQNYMILTEDVVNVPVLHPNENLLRYFENYAKDLLSGVEAGNQITYQVKKLILSYMDNENLSIKMIAKELSMSVRTIQLHLKNEGTEFSKLLQETREQLAKKYLRENYTVEDITYLLGFSDPAAFRKAFKKWIGMTPKEYRDQS